MRLTSFILGALQCSLAAGCGTPTAVPDAFLAGDGGAEGGVDAGRDGAMTVDVGLDANDASLDAFATDGGCPPGPVCVGGVVIGCAADALVATSCAFGCAPDGSGRCAEMDASNVDDALFDAGAPDLMLLTGMTVNTSTCADPLRTASQSDGSMVCVLVAHDVTLPATEALNPTGSRPLVILASGTVTIDGILDLGARTHGPGSGGASGGAISLDGMGSGGGRAGTVSSSTGSAASGGGGGSFCGVGGAGGRGAMIAGGAGGPVVATTDLIPLRGGSGGGVGGAITGVPTPGGSGGGALQISARVAIHVGGVIYAGGGGGDGATAGGGGGGGSGGAILLEAPVLDVTGVLWTAGGGGGGASGTTSGGYGEDARDMRGLLAASGGMAGGMIPGAGGDGAALAMLDGMSGETNGSMDGHGGGGGGGSGCIVLRDTAGTYTPTGAHLSPSVFSSLPLVVH